MVMTARYGELRAVAEAIGIEYKRCQSRRQYLTMKGWLPPEPEPVQLLLLPIFT